MHCNITREICKQGTDETELPVAYNSFCPGGENVETDTASQQFSDQTDLVLRRDMQKCIWSKVLGVLDIDLFASRLSKQVPRFCAWWPDSDTVYIDSFMYDWGEETLVCAFSPLSILQMVIRKFIHDQS